jgi:hypothetical protein
VRRIFRETGAFSRQEKATSTYAFRKAFCQISTESAVTGGFVFRGMGIRHPGIVRLRGWRLILWFGRAAEMQQRRRNQYGDQSTQQI